MAPAAAAPSGGGSSSSSAPRGRTARSFKSQHLFTRDLKMLLYAFGDEPNPRAETVDVLEDIVIDYIVGLCGETSHAAGARLKIKVDDVKFALRGDARKLGRVEELLSMQKIIAEARKTFNEKDV